MNKRQFLKSLAMAAGAVFVPAAVVERLSARQTRREAVSEWHPSKRIGTVTARTSADGSLLLTIHNTPKGGTFTLTDGKRSRAFNYLDTDAATHWLNNA